jgi:hypothetical protein
VLHYTTAAALPYNNCPAQLAQLGSLLLLVLLLLLAYSDCSNALAAAAARHGA